VDGIGFEDKTPFMTASFHGKIGVPRVLFQAGANLNRSGRFTSLGLAAYNGHRLMARQLLLWGADPLGVGTNLETAHQVAVRRGQPAVVRLLDNWGAFQAVWVVSSAGQVRRLSKGSALKFLPKELCRMVGSMLI
jgi:ankyrin repeat protein